MKCWQCAIRWRASRATAGLASPARAMLSPARTTKLLRVRQRPAVDPPDVTPCLAVSYVQVLHIRIGEQFGHDCISTRTVHTAAQWNPVVIADRFYEE